MRTIIAAICWMMMWPAMAQTCPSDIVWHDKLFFVVKDLNISTVVEGSTDSSNTSIEPNPKLSIGNCNVRLNVDDRDAALIGALLDSFRNQTQVRAEVEEVVNRPGSSTCWVRRVSPR